MAESIETGIIKVLTSLLGRPVDTACKLIENLLGNPTHKFGELLGDRIVFWQWKNRIAIIEKADQLMREKNYVCHPLPPDFVIPYIRESGDTSDSELQEKWAELLSSAVHDNQYAHIAFINTLRSMTSNDVLFLETMISIQYVGHEGRIEAVSSASRLTPAESRMSFYNLEHLGFFTPTGSRLKGFAVMFYKACSPNRNKFDAYKEKERKLGRKIIAD